MFVIAGFLICATIIFFAGKRLALYGDLLAEATGFSKGWIGLILLASVTSLPELMVGIGSAAIVQSADLAVGDILGSCVFNLAILAMLDAFVKDHKPITSVASTSHIVNAGLGIILLSLVGLAIFLPYDFPVMPWIGFSSILFIIAYSVSIRIIYNHEQNYQTGKMLPEQEVQNAHSKTELRKIIGSFVLFALIIIAAALALPYFAEGIAEMTGLGKAFVGTFFLAASTSLPEVAVSVAAVRRGSLDLSVGNLLGSNIFNILILAIDDIVYPKGLLLKDASDFNLLSVFSTILMTAVVIIGLGVRTPGKRLWLAWDAIVIFIIYFINLYLLFRFT